MTSNHSLSILKQLAAALAAQFGNECEVVIHDLYLDNLEHSIVHIENGHISGRSLGGGPSKAVLDAIKNRRTSQGDHLAYLARAENGHLLKSSTLYIPDEYGKPRYLFAINFDVTNLVALQGSLRLLTEPLTPPEEDQPDAPQLITHNVNDLLDQLIAQSVQHVGTPAPLMTREQRIKAIQYLNDAGAFLITRSGDKVADYFGISKYTLYSYLNTLMQ